MCWRGLRRKQRRQEGVILVCSPVRVRVRPHVKGWACLAQNTDCTSSTNLSTKTPLGGWRGGECAHISQCRRTLRGFKAALKFLGCGEGWLYGGEQEKEWRGGEEERISRFSSCKADLAEAKPSLPFSFLCCFVGKPSTLFCRACSLPLSRKTQTTKESTLSIKRRHLKEPPPLPRLNLRFAIAELKAHYHMWMKLTHTSTCDVSLRQFNAWLNTPFAPRQIVWRRWNNLLSTHRGSEIEIRNQQPPPPPKINICIWERWLMSHSWQLPLCPAYFWEYLPLIITRQRFTFC